ncbi:MAG: iron-containing alcohol dehydrogenase [Spirochaetaceae bacterium]
MADSFFVTRTPELYFGPGSLTRVPGLLHRLSLKRAFLVTGSGSVRELPQWEQLIADLEKDGGYAGDARVAGEPSPSDVDEIAAAARLRVAEVIIGIGGGSALDAAKAAAVAVMHPGSIRDYLEGVGSKQPTPRRLPLIACPTTAGTGTEATKNAVLREVGPNGFKKSLRHDAYVPDIAVIDPSLAVGVPHRVTAASGLDAITQNLEAYVSTGANCFTDAVALGGLEAAGRSFLRVLEDGGDVRARADMAWAAHTSGIALANAGLGLVHGAAGPAGAMHDIPHGVACGRLLPLVTRATIARLRTADPSAAGGAAAKETLARYARAGTAISGQDRGSVEANCDLLVETLDRFLRAGELPAFSAYGFTREEVRTLAGKSGRKGHPTDFDAGDIEEILAGAL